MSRIAVSAVSLALDPMPPGCTMVGWEDPDDNRYGFNYLRAA
jgi:hypothetical protein